ncbi:MAG: low specificity L-threonine aldolase [Clostridia bacterium]|nr:low specificity L-threonine aldolase [Clostridia bacterium]
MLDFSCDYKNGAHPIVLRRLIETNEETLGTYGFDKYSASAKEKIREAAGAPGADVFFIAGGTQTNMTVISSCLRSYEGVISASTGHINCHESGAVEYAGNKIIALPHREGKIDAEQISAYMSDFNENPSRDHMVFPAMVYISFPTEYGTIYSRKELTDISRVCREYGLMLFLDGARLGYGLCCDGCDVDLPFIASVCDVFYVGGTKVGALCGEAVVFPAGAPAHFITMIKQRGAMLAKSRVLGVQFDALFTDGLYFKIAKNAIDRVKELKAVFSSKGYGFFIDSPTNQQFVILDNETLERLEGKVGFEVWEKADCDHTVVRFATSWATTPGEIEELSKLL